jgi:putative DNA primase/helicase
VTVVPRTGWHIINDHNVFVLPETTIGANSPVILNGMEHAAPYSSRGTIKEWRDTVAALARGQTMLIFAISTALAGPLLSLAEIEGLGVHLKGTSSIGKSSLQKMAASVWGPPSFCRSWSATINGLEGAASGATDTVLILDEIGQVEPHSLAAAAYALANGHGKARARVDGSLREPRTWRVVTLSSGEVSIETKLAEDRGRRAQAGQLVRLIDIDPERAYGVFDSIGEGIKDGADFTNQCRSEAARTYGVAGPEFVRRIVEDGVGGDAVRARINKFIASRALLQPNGQIIRGAQAFGLIAAAGELATEFQLTGWQRGEASKAAGEAFEKWIEGGTDRLEDRRALAQVRALIEQHGASRFESGSLSDFPVKDRLGWRTGVGADEEWRVPPETWTNVFCKGYDPQHVAKYLDQCGLLRRQAGQGLTCSVKVPSLGRTIRCYVVKAAILDGLTPADAVSDDHKAIMASSAGERFEDVDRDAHSLNLTAGVC